MITTAGSLRKAVMAVSEGTIRLLPQSSTVIRKNGKESIDSCKKMLYNINLKDKIARILYMDSLALAYMPKTTTSKSVDTFSVKVNINLWTQCGWKNEVPVLDIGLMLYNLPLVKELRLYFPFDLETNQIKDLCTLLAHDQDLTGAVFNEPYSIHNDPSIPKKTRVELVSGQNSPKKSDAPFALYCLDPENDIKLESFKTAGAEVTGTFATINVDSIVDDMAANNGGRPADPKITNYYLRFRIQSPQLSDSVREYKAPNRFFETLVTSTYMVELRFNNTRSMHSTLVEKLTSRDGYQLAPIQSLHMLLMTKVYVDVDSSSFNSSRAIEENIWNKYVEQISGGEQPKDIIAYHAKSTAKENTSDIGSWEFFTRMRAGKFSIQTIIPYILILAIITVTFNIVTDVVICLLTIILPTVNLLIKKIAAIIIGALCVFFALRRQRNKQ